MIKYFLFLLVITTSLFANELNLNANINSFSLTDQFNKMHTIDRKVKTIIVSFEKDTSKDINEFLSSKKVDFLNKNSAVFIANISAMPSIITRMFALPKMKKYKHNILLIYDENDKRFVQKDDKLTVYKLDNTLIKSINFINPKELAKVFN